MIHAESESARLRTPWSLFVTVALSVLASPAAAFWRAAAGTHSRALRVLRWVIVGVVAVLAGLLLQAPMRWQLVAAAWSAFCLLGGLVVGLSLGTRTSDDEDVAHLALHPDGWAQATLRAGAPVAFLLPSLLVLTRLISWSLLGGVLARLNPRAIDPQEALALLVVDVLWLVPLGWIFAAVSYRRGRLWSGADVLHAIAAWGVVLLFHDLVLAAGFGALSSQLIPLAGFSDWGVGQAFVIHLLLAVATLPLALFLAWSQRPRWWQRAASLALLFAAAFLNLGLVVGGNAVAQFALGRVAERSFHPRSALHWYDRSLRSNSHPAQASYLRHRVGLLRYREGDVEGAIAAWKQETAASSGNEELVGQARYFLERLEANNGGERVALPGLEVRSEHRRAYCAPNTLALAFGLLGVPVSVGDLAEQATLLGVGTSGSDIRFLAERLGFDFYVHAYATLADLRWLVDHGLPALVFIPGHVLAVVGYDQRLGTFVSFDTARWETWVDRPWSDLEEDWGRDAFTLGVVVRHSDSSASATAARQRFDTPWAHATWSWWLASEQAAGAERAALQRRALQQAPTFFPAAFDLLRYPRSTRESVADWLDEHADMDGALQRAREALDRRGVEPNQIARGLATWLDLRAAPEQLVDLAVTASQRGFARALQPEAGEAALALGQAERAAFLLDQANDNDPDVLTARANAKLALGQEDAAANDLTQLLRRVSDDRLESVLAIAGSLAEGRSPSYRANLYESYLHHRPGDVESYLLLAEASLAALDENAEARSELIRQVRKAATTARLLAQDETQKERAAQLLESLDQRTRTLDTLP